VRILFWFRKDLRLDDNTGLAEAVRDARGDVIPFYTSEPAILSRDDIAATRVRFVLDSLADLAAAIERAGSRLALAHGDAVANVTRAARDFGADAVYWNDEYEPALRARDDAVERALSTTGIRVRRFHDRLLVPPGAVTTRGGRPFVVFTPFARTCDALPVARPVAAVRRLAPHDLPGPRLATLEQLGFATTQPPWPGGARAGATRLKRFLAKALPDYATGRDRLDADGTSRLSADLKFGTVSVRRVVAQVLEAAQDDRRLRTHAAKYVSELRWRDFYSHVLFHFPQVERGAFRPQFGAIRWAGKRAHFDAWTSGRTGYPIVDAGMRQLAATGYMHNRARMIVASFLTKDLLLDWRLGERHFMRHLVDGDLANNNGGWQWAAGTGTDAQPWFRVFNPVLQGQRFDPDGAYVRRWVPELAKVPDRWVHRPWDAPAPPRSYPAPVVDHAEQRDRALAMYRAVSNSLTARRSKR